MKKQTIITVVVVVFVLSIFSIWSMTSKLENVRITSHQSEVNSNRIVTNEGILRNKSDLICSAQGDIRPPAWDEEEDYVPSGS